MGSLYSKPKIPVAAAPLVIQTPPAADTAILPDAPASDGDAEKAAGVVRRRSLPQTVLTSFRGVLGQGEWVPARKSLLGE